MPIIKVDFDTRRFRATLDDLGRHQFPYAASRALNETARAAAKQVTSELPSIFNAKGARPTPFTMRAIGTQGATKSRLIAQVFVKRDQAKYLGIEQSGGTRSRKPGEPIVTPVDAKTNAYKNLPRGMVRKLLTNPKRYFLGSVRGVYGLWERLPKDKLKLLVSFHEHATWRPRFDFYVRVEKAVNARFASSLSSWMAKAIATANKK